MEVLAINYIFGQHLIEDGGPGRCQEEFEQCQNKRWDLDGPAFVVLTFKFLGSNDANQALQVGQGPSNPVPA
jgi:hypothetical protein